MKIGNIYDRLTPELTLNFDNTQNEIIRLKLKAEVISGCNSGYEDALYIGVTNAKESQKTGNQEKGSEN